MRPTTIVIAAQFVSMVLATTALPQTVPPPSVTSLGDCRLSSGAVLPNCRVAYRAYGRLNVTRDNVVLIPTWLLGRSEDWLPLLTAEPLVDTTRFYVIVVDALADGLSSSPSNTVRGARGVFRDLTIGDMVESQYRLLTERLGVHHLRAVMGFSMGGMQAIEWAVRYPSFIDRIVPIAGTPRVGAFNRLVLTAMLDEIVDGRRAGIPADSLWPRLARTEMLFVQTPIGLNARGGDSVEHDIAANARQYRVWDLDDYAAQIAALRRYNVIADYGDDMHRAAARVRARMLAVYSWDDHMVSPDAMAEFARMVGADTLSIASSCGHVMVFCEQRRVGAATRAFISQRKPQSLFNGKDLSGWHVDVPTPDSNVRVRNPFIVRKGMLVSLGEPRGHLITDSSYRDYRLELEYRFPAAPGNAGVLVHASTPRALYGMFPRSIEVQMEHGNAGDFWCILEDIRVPDMERRRGPPADWGTTEGKARRILNLTDDSEKPLGEWNSMVIEAVGRSIRVWVNGDLVNDGSYATADRGQIAVQSEGSQVEFRKLSLTAPTTIDHR